MDTPLKIKEPKGLADYILRNCAKETYLIFDPKIDLCVCTRCQTKKKISKMNDGEYLKHNRKHFCYECGEEAICKEWRYGRKNITDYGRILYLIKRGRTTYGQLDEYIINYDRLMIPSVSTWTSAQYKFNSDEQIGYRHHPGGYWSFENWTTMKTIKVPAPQRGAYYYTSKFEDTYLYAPSTYGTDLKYAKLDMKRFNASELGEAEYLISYISLFLKYQSIELLEKAGFENVVRDKVKGYVRGNVINWRGKNLRKILKMNNAEIKEARKLHLGMSELRYYRKGKAMFPGFNVADSISLVKRLPYWDSQWEELQKKIEKYVPIQKLIKYILTQSDMRFSDYNDYLEECHKLGMDMRDKKILFPADLKAAHRRTSEQIRIETDKKMEEDFRIQERKIIPMDEPYIFNGYLIRPAECPEELHKESEALHHCVRTYVDKVAKGGSAILFIRKQEEPDQPLFTLELDKNRKIVQCRGLKNCSYPDDVGELIKHWEKDIVRKIV